MRYPDALRRLVGAVPFRLDITGRRRDIFLRTLDRFFGFESGHSQRSVSVDAVRLQLDISRPGERLLFYGMSNLLRGYRRSDLYRVMRALADGGLFVDIGANLGIYSLLARGLGMEALLFEPEPFHAAFLTRNGPAFGHVVQCALSDSVGVAPFFVSAERNPGASSLVLGDRGWDASGYDHVVEVRVSTFDLSVEELGVASARIQLIKIDVEGNEEHTLQGMTRYLSDGGAAPIWCEVRGKGSDRGENNYSRIVPFMRQFSYDAYRLTGGALAPFAADAGSPAQVFDLLFVRPEQHRYLSSALERPTSE